MDKEWFKQKMRENSLTQEDVGQLLGKDRSTFSRILSGEFEFRMQYLEPLSLAFKTSKMEILRRCGVLNDEEIDGNESAFSRVEDAIRAYKNGEILIVTDDYDRENEGDLIVAADHCTPEKMAFIIRHTSGIVCAPISAKIARKLHLDPMVAVNDAPHATAFTISVDARHGTTTGISASDRCNTVLALANNNAGADEFVRPGHIFPLVAKQGGVLVRAGHTEAAVDLCKLAKLSEVGVICEMVNDDGSVMRGEQITEFGKQHNLRHITIADLIQYRQAKENLVEALPEFSIETSIGACRAIPYRSKFDTLQHLAIIYGNIDNKKSVPTRLHRENIADDLFGSNNTINACLKAMQPHGCGVLIYLREGALGVAENANYSAKNEDGRQVIWRETGIGAQILRDLGIKSINLMSRTNPRFAALKGFDITIEEVMKI